LQKKEEKKRLATKSFEVWKRERDRQLAQQMNEIKLKAEEEAVAERQRVEEKRVNAEKV
jgi:hypothetical protein